MKFLWIRYHESKKILTTGSCQCKLCTEAIVENWSFKVTRLRWKSSKLCCRFKIDISFYFFGRREFEIYSQRNAKILRRLFISKILVNIYYRFSLGNLFLFMIIECWLKNLNQLIFFALGFQAYAGWIALWANHIVTRRLLASVSLVTKISIIFGPHKSFFSVQDLFIYSNKEQFI